MPIEIRELVIKATIDETAQQQATPAAGSGGGQVDEKAVQKIVDEVLRKIRNINER
ncbi:MAG: hypothetical protein K0R82_1587 [Flavipsychrobacter sp.]|jgi:hypothetical protein|nr:hypothetical protein [Flavipsychrobacter sp.]